MGSPPAATITMPDMGAHDRMLDRQIEAMNSGRQQEMLLAQEQLNRAVRGQQAALAASNQAAQQRAADTSANAARIAALIGTPAPQASAKAPVVGRDRSGRSGPGGRDLLRIRQARSAAAGSGLNIGGA